MPNYDIEARQTRDKLNSISHLCVWLSGCK